MIVERPTIEPVGPAVDPWDGHPLFPRYARYLRPVEPKLAPTMLLPVIQAGPGRHRRR